MVYFFFVITTSLYFLSPGSHLLDLSQGLHQSCLNFTHSQYFNEIQDAFVCGSNLTSPENFQLFQTTGLLHLIVVSGSHLVFIQNWCEPILKRFQWRSVALLVIFALYACCCLWDPPIARATLFFLITIVSRKLRWQTSSYKRILWSGLLCFCLNPGWLHSQSLMLSWLASLAISTTDKLINQCALCYFLLCPILFQYSTVHPITIAMNIVVAPIFGLALLPITVIGNLLSPMEPFSDGVWVLTLKVLNQLAIYIPAPEKTNGASSSASILWLYVFGIQGGLWWLQIQKNLKAITPKKSTSKTQTLYTP